MRFEQLLSDIKHTNGVVVRETNINRRITVMPLNRTTLDNILFDGKTFMTAAEVSPGLNMCKPTTLSKEELMADNWRPLKPEDLQGAK